MRANPKGDGEGTCLTCGRELKDYRTCDRFDPAMNCGGDCAACQREFERGFCDQDWAGWDAHHGTAA